MSQKKKTTIFAAQTLIILCAFFSSTDFVCAQEQGAFDSLEIGLKYVANINRNLFHDFYQPGFGIEGFVEAPFYYGTLTAAVQILPYSATQEENSQDFLGVFTNLKWGKGYALPHRVRWFVGVGMGLYAFVPGDSTLSDPYQVAHFTETELAAGLNSHWNYPIAQNWMLRFEGNYHRIFTYKPIDLVYFSTGIGYAFATPKWLKGFLE